MSLPRVSLGASAALALMALFFFVAPWATSVGEAQATGIAFVQSNHSDPQAPQTTVAVAYTAAQTAGNLNVVVVGWNDSTAHVLTVTDARGNAYALAVGPTVQSGLAAQSN